MVVWKAILDKWEMIKIPTLWSDASLWHVVKERNCVFRILQLNIHVLKTRTAIEHTCIKNPRLVFVFFGSNSLKNINIQYHWLRHKIILRNFVLSGIKCCFHTLRELFSTCLDFEQFNGKQHRKTGNLVRCPQLPWQRKQLRSSFPLIPSK